MGEVYGQGKEMDGLTACLHSQHLKYAEYPSIIGDIIGSMGYEDVKLGSLSIPQQQMAFINSTSGGVDSSVSGIMGLAFPSLDQVCLPSAYSS